MYFLSYKCFVNMLFSELRALNDDIENKIRISTLKISVKIPSITLRNNELQHINCDRQQHNIKTN